MIYTNKMKFGLTCMVLALLSVGAIGWVAAADRTAVTQKVDFAPIFISLSCQSDTPSAVRIKYQRAKVSNPGIDPVECADQRSSLNDIYPEKVATVYRRNFESWAIVIFVSERDAPKIRAASKDWVGKKVLIGVNGRVVTYAILNAPLSDKKIYMSVDSEDLANKMLSIFVKS